MSNKKTEATDPHCVGVLKSANQPLVSLYGVVVVPAATDQMIMGFLGSAFRRYCKSKKLDIPPATFNLHLIGRGENDKRGYPELDSNVKAIHTKVIVFFLADLMQELSQLCQCSLDTYLKLVYFYCTFFSFFFDGTYKTQSRKKTLISPR